MNGIYNNDPVYTLTYKTDVAINLDVVTGWFVTDADKNMVAYAETIDGTYTLIETPNSSEAAESSAEEPSEEPSVSSEEPSEAPSASSEEPSETPSETESASEEPLEEPSTSSEEP